VIVINTNKDEMGMDVQEVDVVAASVEAPADMEIDEASEKRSPPNSNVAAGKDVIPRHGDISGRGYSYKMPITFLEFDYEGEGPF
jgi:hypothetical protein